GNTYSAVAALQEKQLLFAQVISSYDKLMEATRKQLEVGTISVTEALRLESEYLAIKTEALSNYNEKEKALSDLKIILRFPADTTFFVEQIIPLIAGDFDPKLLAEQAVSSHPDLGVKKLNLKYEERNLKLQRSVAVPDIKFAYQPRDRGSNYVRPYQGFNVEMSLPLFDRNQGGIKAAQQSVDKVALEFDQMENQVRNEVVAAYNRYKSSGIGLSNYKIDFMQKLSELNQSTIENFRKRNIGLLQFIDQQRIYVQTNLQMIELKQLFINNVNELNFSVGTNLIEY
ncbi:MAG: TolC family protein, partial [Flammeovirgaceae bacterium]|nr:TolC family protein [Flammeovirgaceae bacterium]